MRLCEAAALPPRGIGTPHQGKLSSDLLNLTSPTPPFTPDLAAHSPGASLHFSLFGLEFGSSIQCLN